LLWRKFGPPSHPVRPKEFGKLLVIHQLSAEPTAFANHPSKGAVRIVLSFLFSRAPRPSQPRLGEVVANVDRKCSSRVARSVDRKAASQRERRTQTPKLRRSKLRTDSSTYHSPTCSSHLNSNLLTYQAATITRRGAEPGVCSPHVKEGPAWRRLGNRDQKEKAKTTTILPK
jgi:hypothetical protein